MPRHKIGFPTNKADPTCPDCHGFGTRIVGSFVKRCHCVQEPSGSKATSPEVASFMSGLGVSR